MDHSPWILGGCFRRSIFTHSTPFRSLSHRPPLLCVTSSAFCSRPLRPAFIPYLTLCPAVLVSLHLLRHCRWLSSSPLLSPSGHLGCAFPRRDVFSRERVCSAHAPFHCHVYPSASSPSWWRPTVGVHFRGLVIRPSSWLFLATRLQRRPQSGGGPLLVFSFQVVCFAK